MAAGDGDPDAAAGFSWLSGWWLGLLALNRGKANAVALWWILGLFGFELDLMHATFIFALAMLAGALSLIPGELGANEAVMTDLPNRGGGLRGGARATPGLRLWTLQSAMLPGPAGLLTDPHAGNA